LETSSANKELTRGTNSEGLITTAFPAAMAPAYEKEKIDDIKAGKINVWTRIVLKG